MLNGDATQLRHGEVLELRADELLDDGVAVLDERLLADRVQLFDVGDAVVEVDVEEPGLAEHGLGVWMWNMMPPSMGRHGRTRTCASWLYRLSYVPWRSPRDGASHVARGAFMRCELLDGQRLLVLDLAVLGSLLSLTSASPVGW